MARSFFPTKCRRCRAVSFEDYGEVLAADAVWFWARKLNQGRLPSFDFGRNSEKPLNNHRSRLLSASPLGHLRMYR